MPIDPGIVDVPATRQGGYSPLKALAQADVFVAQQRKAQAEQAEAQRQELVNRTVQKYPDDPYQAISELRRVDWQAAQALEKQVTEHKTKMLEMYGKELENKFKQGQVTEQQAKAEHDALLRGALDDWAKLDGIDPKGAEEKAKFLMGPDKWLDMKAKIETQKQLALDREADNARQAEAAKETGRHNLATEQVAMTAAERQASAAAEAARHNRAMEGNAAARLKAEGAGAGGAKLSAGAIEKVAGVDQSMGMLDDIEKLLPKMADNIGIMDGRVARAKLMTGRGITQELAEFDAQLTGLKNAVIKATTGAAMSEPEAKRIMGQLPDLTQPEAVFRARMATTRKNLETLKRRTIELSGGTMSSPSTAGAGPKPTGRFNPATGKVEPVQ